MNLQSEWRHIVCVGFYWRALCGQKLTDLDYPPGERGSILVIDILVPIDEKFLETVKCDGCKAFCRRSNESKRSLRK